MERPGIRDILVADSVAMKVDLVAMKVDLVAMKADLLDMTEDLVGMKADLAGMKVDLAVTKEDSLAMKVDLVDIMKVDLAAMKEALADTWGLDTQGMEMDMMVSITLMRIGIIMIGDMDTKTHGNTITTTIIIMQINKT